LHQPKLCRSPSSRRNDLPSRARGFDRDDGGKKMTAVLHDGREYGLKRTKRQNPEKKKAAIRGDRGF
jgi:hypothetical protein